MQFSWGLYTQNGERKEIKNFIIKPDGWTMKGSERIHGISQERATNGGASIKDVLAEYKQDIDNHCCQLVCHNVDFDKIVVQSELMRLQMEVTDVSTYCTMKEATNFCKLHPMKRGQYKWPKLEELYSTCFNAELENAHNSYYDVVNTAKMLFCCGKEAIGIQYV